VNGTHRVGVRESAIGQSITGVFFYGLFEMVDALSQASGCPHFPKLLSLPIMSLRGREALSLGGYRQDLDFVRKAVTFSSYRLDKLWFPQIVTKQPACCVDGNVEAVLGKTAGRPQFLGQFFPSDQTSRIFQQGSQQKHWLRSGSYFVAVPMKLPHLGVQSELAKSKTI